MAQVRFAYSFYAVINDQFDDPLKARPDVVGERIEGFPNPFIEKFNDPLQLLRVYRFCNAKRLVAKRKSGVSGRGV